MEILAELPTILGSATITGGALMVLSFLLLQRGIIHTHGELQRTVDANDKAHEVALESKNEIIVEVRKNEAQAITDRDVYRKAAEVQSERANLLQSKMIEEVLPLVRVAMTALDALPKVGDE